ncbi:MAG: hypothetical protein JJ971_04365 [Balneolaceae bacterium]|nr:hypothetical protein [Balneolaceae bacterium]MBO6545608.1 hypothetical protein [Balneolaceae bacterium]MBO6647004.1 hypothetical protein [Balneolaceae bacterium]
MKEQQDYIQDLAEIRSMMERSSKFLSLSGLSGVLAGMYACAGAYIAYFYFNFRPDGFEYAINRTGDTVAGLPPVLGLAILVLILSVGTALVLSSGKAKQKGENIWNIASRKMLASVSVPLLTGGVFVLLLLASGYSGLAAPATLIFYGLALTATSVFTFEDVKYLGWIQIVLGLAAIVFISYSILLWAIGFGIFHIGYGLFIHLKYERS